MKMNFYSLKDQDDTLFKNRFKKTTFVLRILNTMLNFKVDRISYQQLEYEMDRADIPDYYIF